MDTDHGCDQLRVTCWAICVSALLLICGLAEYTPLDISLELVEAQIRAAARPDSKKPGALWDATGGLGVDSSGPEVCAVSGVGMMREVRRSTFFLETTENGKLPISQSIPLLARINFLRLPNTKHGTHTHALTLTLPLANHLTTRTHSGGVSSKMS